MGAKTIRICAIIAASMGLITAASGVRPTPSTAPQVLGITACRRIASAEQRLACFDQTARALDEAIDRHEVVVVEKQEIRRARRSLFGFDLPSLAIFSGDDKSELPFRAIDSNVTRVTNVGYGKFDIAIEDGAVWRNIELLQDPPRVGDKVHIAKTVVGGYFLKTRLARAVRAQRAR